MARLTVSPHDAENNNHRSSYHLQQRAKPLPHSQLKISTELTNVKQFNRKLTAIIVQTTKENQICNPPKYDNH